VAQEEKEVVDVTVIGDAPATVAGAAVVGAAALATVEGAAVVLVW
jgi:hypothetical protein